MADVDKLAAKPQLASRLGTATGSSHSARARGTARNIRAEARSGFDE